MVEVVPIKDAAHGANIFGTDLSGNIIPNLMKILTDTLYEHRFFIIKKQEYKKAKHLEFSKLWGLQFHTY
tara:strand:- start:302 stop:511 length:210 start_codon:yes stop_codon:yes gene_type:complete